MKDINVSLRELAIVEHNFVLIALDIVWVINHILLLFKRHLETQFPNEIRSF